MAETQIVSNADNFLDDIGTSKTFIVHFRIQQRGNKKSMTTITGIPERYDHELILKHFKKTFSCNGTIFKNEEGRTVFKLSGDHRKACEKFFLEQGILLPENIKMHGF